jgi:hypothetical protein
MMYQVCFVMLHKVRVRKSPKKTLANSTESVVVVNEFCVPSRQRPSLKKIYRKLKNALDLKEEFQLYNTSRDFDGRR